MGLALHKQDDLSEQDYLEGEKTSTIKYEYIFLVPKLRFTAIKLSRHLGKDSLPSSSECRDPKHRDVIDALPSMASGFRQSMPE